MIQCFCGKFMNMRREERSRRVVYMCESGHEEYRHDDGGITTNPKLSIMGQTITSMTAYNDT